uniref:Sorting nexin-3 n=1 Tax=Romanomermis culicivorax TaxID=13658 RepID=A0A915JEH0_ROMCU
EHALVYPPPSIIDPPYKSFSALIFCIQKCSGAWRCDHMIKTNLPVFKLKESSVRRRYSDFEWLRNELERDSKIVVPSLPGKALKRQLPFRSDDGIFEEAFIEARQKNLEQFVN